MSEVEYRPLVSFQPTHQCPAFGSHLINGSPTPLRWALSKGVSRSRDALSSHYLGPKSEIDTLWFLLGVSPSRLRAASVFMKINAVF